MKSDSIYVDAEFIGPLAKTLRRHAEARSIKPCELFADIIEAVFGEDLVDAILDDRPQAAKDKAA
jgi:hypothetical protein